MFFKSKSKNQKMPQTKEEYKAELTEKIINWHTRYIAESIKFNRKDCEIYLLNSLALAMELDLISLEIYRDLQKQAQAADTKIDAYWKEQDKLEKEFNKAFKAATTQEEKDKLLAEYKKKSWRYQYENK